MLSHNVKYRTACLIAITIAKDDAKRLFGHNTKEVNRRIKKIL
jgi:hypothetical protein